MVRLGVMLSEQHKAATVGTVISTEPEPSASHLAARRFRNDGHCSLSYEGVTAHQDRCVTTSRPRGGGLLLRLYGFAFILTPQLRRVCQCMAVVCQPPLTRGRILRLNALTLRSPVRQGCSGCEISACGDKAGATAYLGNDVQDVAAGRIRVEGYTPTKVRLVQARPAQVRPS